MHADARLHAGLFRAGESASLVLAPGRHGWVHVARGRLSVNGHALGAGDALALSDEPAVRIEGLDQPDPANAARGSEVLVFDLP